MARRIGMSANVQLRKHQLKNLAQLLLKAKNEKEMLALLHTLMTTSEKESIAQRLHITLKIRHGMKYYEIESSLGVSSSTIIKALDLYHKNGDENHLFNQMLSEFKEPELKYDIQIDYPNKLDRRGKSHIPGTFRWD